MPDDVIGAVAVAVTPDAQGFWRDFEARTNAQADQAGRNAGNRWQRGFTDATRGTDVKVRADVHDADAKIAALREEARRGATFNIRTDGGLSIGQVASLTAATNRLSDAQARLKDATARQKAMATQAGVTDLELADAADKVARAQRDEAMAALRLAAAQETVAESQNRARESADREAAAQQKAAIAAGKAEQQHIGLIGALSGFVPAIVPIAAAAGVAGGALASMAIQGTLAVKGAAAAMKSSTADGIQFAGAVNVVRADLNQLEGTAAHNTLGAFQTAVTRAHAQLPALNADLARSSQVLGQIGDHLVHGLLGGERTFTTPLIAAENVVGKLAARFDTWATGPGGAKFASTLSTDFAQVEPVLEKVGTAIAHVVSASNGPGLLIVHAIGDLAGALDEVPVPVLSVLVTGLAGLRIASVVSRGLDLMTGSLVKMTAAEDAAAVSTRGLAASQGALGAGTAGAAAKPGLLARGAGFLSKATGAALLGYFGGQALSSATSGWRQSGDAGKFFLGNLGQGVGNVFSGHFGSVISDMRNNQIGRDLSDSTLNRYRYATSDFYQTQAGDFRLGALHQVYNPRAGAYGGQLLGTTGNHEITTGYGSVAPGVNRGPSGLNGLFGSSGLSGLTGTTKAVQALTGAERIGAEKALVYRQAHTQIAQAFAQVTTAAPHQTVSQLATSYTTLGDNLQKSIDAQSKWLDQGGKTVDTIDGVKIGEKTLDSALQLTNGDYQKAKGLIAGRVEALKDSQKQALVASQREQRLTEAVGAAGAKYHLSADQVGMYAQIVGISSEKVAEGVISQRDFVTAIGEVAHVVSQGNTAIQGWVAAVAQFQKGEDTAATRAQLLGAALVAFNGDALQYQNVMVGAAVANQQLVTDFAQLRRGVLNLKTGTLDYHNAAAAPVLNDLQQLQTAAQNAAAATYQHEVSIKGASQASTDAANVYKNDTYNALAQEAQQLGLTSGQAHRLAKEYFGLPKDVVTRIRQLGAGTTNALLNAIGQQLSYISHHAWNANIYASDHASGVISSVQAQLNHMRDRTVFLTVVEQQLHGGRGVARAMGGLSVGGVERFANGGLEDHRPAIYPAIPGRVRVFAEPETLGEAFIPLANDHRRPRARLIAAETVRLLGGVAAFEGGGFTGVQYGGGGSGRGSGSSGGGHGGGHGGGSQHAAKRAVVYVVLGQEYSSYKSAVNAANRILQGRIKIGVKIETTGLQNLARAMSKTGDAARSAYASIDAQLSKLGAGKKPLDALRTLNNGLDKQIDARNATNARIASLVSAEKDLSNQVKQSIGGAFDITSAGTGPAGDQRPSFGSINAEAAQDLNKVKQLSAGLRKLLKLGLNKTEVVQLAEKGVDALPQVLALEQASPKQIAELDSEYAQINAQGASLGKVIGESVYGGSINKLTAQRNAQNKAIVDKLHSIEQRIDKLTDTLEHRPVNVKVGSRTVYRASQAGLRSATR